MTSREAETRVPGGGHRAPQRNTTNATHEFSRVYFRARLALLLIAGLAAVPSPLTPFWGGSNAALLGVLGSPIVPLAVVFAWASLSWWSRSRSRQTLAAPAGWSLVADVVALTALLSLGGAAQNPFTMLYFVPIALSTLTAERTTWIVAGSAVLGFVTLLAVTIATAGPHAQHGHFFHHVVGMAAALAVAGVLVTYFVHRVGAALRLQQAEIARLSLEREQDRFATSLGALAAGAAHELGTPLGTIQLLSGELLLMTEQERATAARTIEHEVTRMKGILHGMTSNQLSAQVLASGTSWTTAELGQQLESELDGVEIATDGDTAIGQPRLVLGQILRELVRNAQRASAGSSARVRVDLVANASGLRFSVEDQGPGSRELERMLGPTVSTTGGHGLGLYLARVHTRQLGGQLTISSELGSGTRVVLTLPLSPPFSYGVVS